MSKYTIVSRPVECRVRPCATTKLYIFRLTLRYPHNLSNHSLSPFKSPSFGNALNNCLSYNSPIMTIT